MFKENIVDIHADDYGYTLNTSKEILECIKKGCMDSISIMCNTSAFEESMDLLYKEIPNLEFLPLLTVHLNFVEGFCLSNSSLLSRNGINTSSWGDLLIGSLGGMKNDLKYQLKQEIKAQIEKTSKAINKCIEMAKINNVKCYQKGIRVDSHVHTHPIPLIFDALTEVIEEENYNVEYIRNPKEPIIPFLRKPNILFSCRFINYAKNIILNIFSYKIDRYSQKKKLNRMYMIGLLLSGDMNNRVYDLYGDVIKYSRKHKRTIEFVFHPGIANREEISDELNVNYFNSFNSLNKRKTEKDTIMRLKDFIE